MQRIKAMGFSDARIMELTGRTKKEVVFRREVLDVHPVFKRIDTCAAEFPSKTPYMYACYEGNGLTKGECEAEPSVITSYSIHYTKLYENG